jgi:hypothetical protein
MRARSILAPIVMTVAITSIGVNGAAADPVPRHWAYVAGGINSTDTLNIRTGPSRKYRILHTLHHRERTRCYTKYCGGYVHGGSYRCPGGDSDNYWTPVYWGKRKRWVAGQCATYGYRP